MILRRTAVSNNVIRRLPRYLRKLDELQETGVNRVSSFELGEQLGFTPSQVRQDFSNFGEFGQQGYGYNVSTLRDQIANILGMNQGYKAILVGAGNIGKALLDNFSFTDCGVHLLAAFDIRESLIGTSFHGVPVLALAQLEEFLNENEVAIAVLCVPKNVAVSIADLIIGKGIPAIWNFTNVELTEPGSRTIVENIHFSDSLLCLNFKISEKQDNKGDS